MNLDEALQTFIIESNELLEQMEESLLRLEQQPQDGDSINAIFRAAHTIKGSSGLFGLDFVVSFTHVAESVLDRVRSNELAVDSAIIAIFLDVCDHIGRLIQIVKTGQMPDEVTHQRSESLVQALSVYLKQTLTHTPTSSNETSAVNTSPTLTSSESASWHISIRFGEDVFRSGMDPFSFVRYMNTIGTVKGLQSLWHELPSLAEMDAESCYIGMEIRLESAASLAEIEAVFDFVREDCTLHIFAPNTPLETFAAYIETQPEAFKLADVLMNLGTVSQQALQQLNASINGNSNMGAVNNTSSNTVGNQTTESNAQSTELAQTLKNNKSTSENLIRVDAQKLDKLIDMVGELIIAGASASLIAQQEQNPKLLEATSEISRLVEEVRDSALSLRMVSIGPTFNRFNRVVRDVSKELGKEIRLVISGEDTELDKTVVEKIGDPLTHLVRNSMDHGIEPAEVRLAKGKPAEGTLKFNAYHDSGSIVIEVSDDGGGLNKDKILAKAIEKGLVTDSQNLSDKDIYNLIFEAGFSTADAVSNLSGRGVGMDVVRRNIQALRGTIDIHSEMDKGTTMRIRLPLTLAIIDGFLVNVGDAAYVIPLDMVIECIELGAWADQNCEGNYLNLRGEVLPFCRLRDHFEIDAEPAKRENVVIVKHGENKVGFVVDKLLGEFQTVIKPLGKVFSQIRGIGGFTILGSGEVALILDVSGLIKQIAEQPVEQTSNTKELVVV